MHSTHCLHLEYDRFLSEVIRAGEKSVFAHLNRNLYGQLTLRVRRITQAEFSLAVDPTVRALRFAAIHATL